MIAHVPQKLMAVSDPSVRRQPDGRHVDLRGQVWVVCVEPEHGETTVAEVEEGVRTRRHQKLEQLEEHLVEGHGRRPGQPGARGQHVDPLGRRQNAVQFQRRRFHSEEGVPGCRV
ncbi:hypothetical protein MRX96_050700 [Rhipicephalus microplus]